MKSYLKFLSRNKLYTAIEAVGLAGNLFDIGPTIYDPAGQRWGKKKTASEVSQMRFLSDSN